MDAWKEQNSWWWQQMLIQLCVLFSSLCHSLETCAMYTGKCVMKTQAFLCSTTEKNYGKRRRQEVYLEVLVNLNRLKRKISCNSTSLIFFISFNSSIYRCWLSKRKPRWFYIYADMKDVLWESGRDGISLFHSADKREKAIQVLFTSGAWLEHIRRNKVRCEKGN